MNVVPERVIPVKSAATEVMVPVITSVPLVVVLLPTENELVSPVVSPVEILVKVVDDVSPEVILELLLKTLVGLTVEGAPELVVEGEKEGASEAIVDGPVELTILVLIEVAIGFPPEVSPVRLCGKAALVELVVLGAAGFKLLPGKNGG